MTSRIVFLVSGLGVGGAEVHTLALRAGLTGPEWSSALLAYGSRHAPAMMERPGAQGAVRLCIRGMSSPLGWLRIWRQLRRDAPDLVVAVNQSPLIVSVVTRLLGGFRAPIACIYHTTVLRPGDERQQSLFRRALRRADALVYVSHRQADYGRAHGLSCRREIVIPNGVDAGRFAPDPAARARMRAELGIGDHEIVFGTVASLWEAKNHLHIVEALAQLRRRALPARAIFVGDGPMRQALAERAKALSVDDHLVVIGDTQDVRPYLAAFDVGVLPSVAVETFSIAALECLSSGVPMVMSDIGGAAEIVEDGVNGRLVPPGDLAALVEALAELAEPGTRLRMAEAARPSVERYGLARMIEAYRALLSDLAR